MVPAPHPISLSTSIVCYNTAPEELRALLASLLQAIRTLQESCPTSANQIYLVDNSDTAAWQLDLFASEADNLEQLDTEMRLLRGHGNVGFGRGHNMVIEQVASDFHLILNPDVVLEKQSLAEGINYLQQHTGTAIVSPYATGYDSNKQHLCKTYPAVLTFLVRGFFPGPFKKIFANRLGKYEMHHLPEDEPSSGIPIVSGCFMLCRTELLRTVGGFDDSYFLYFEDFDLSLRIRKVGDIAYLPTMRISHTGGHAARKGIRHLQMFIRSGLRFFRTHGWQLIKQN